MALMVVLHRVANYEAWRKVYDELRPVQKAAGVTAERVYRAKDDANNVLVMHNFATMSEAVEFVDNAEIRDAMERAGVQGAPRFEFYDEV